MQSLQPHQQPLIILGERFESLHGHWRGFRIDVELGVFQRELQEVVGKFPVVLHVSFLAPFLHLVQRRLGDKHVSPLDEFGHLPEEKCQQQRADVRAINIRIGHDDDAVIAQFVSIKLVTPDTTSERGD